MKSYDETPWWCQLLWPWFGPPWYAEIEDPDAWLAAIRRHLARVDELTDEIAGDDTPREEYLAKAGRLTAARHQAEEIHQARDCQLSCQDSVLPRAAPRRSFRLGTGLW